MVERGGTLGAEEKQLAKRYAVFFRMPRLSGNSPPDLNKRDRNGSSVSDNVSQSAPVDITRHQQPVQEDYTNTVSMSTQQMENVNYDPAMFDPQNFPQLPLEYYDTSNEIDFGFSDFFGGYRDLSYVPS